MSTKLPAGTPSSHPIPSGDAAPTWQGSSQWLVPPPEEGINWRRYVAALLRHKWLIVSLTLLGSAGGFVASRAVKPTYVAQGTVWVGGQGSTGDRGTVGPIRPGQLLDSYAWIDLLKSFVVLEEVVRQQRLYVSPRSGAEAALFGSFSLKDRFAPGAYRLRVSDDGRAFELRTAEGLMVQRGAPGDSIGAALGFVWTPPAAMLQPGREIAFSLATPRDAALQLQTNLQARIDLNGNFIRVELSGTDPELIARTVNATLDQYIDVAAQLKRERLTELTKILEEQVSYARRNLAEAEVALEDFRVRTITLPTERATPIAPGLEVTRDPVFSRFFDMQVTREQLRQDREAVERQLTRLDDSTLSVDGMMVIASVQNSPALSQALTELTNRQAELRSLQNRYTGAHPEVERLTSAVRDLAHRTIPGLARDLIRDLRTREGDLAERISSGARDLEQIPVRHIEEGRLRRAVASAETLYNNLLARHEEARLAEASTTPDIQVLDHAVAPKRPVRNTAPHVMAIALAGSLGVALVLALLLDRIDRRLRYPEQVTADLGLPILGAVPHANGANRNSRSGADASQVLEGLRGVRLSLTHAYGAAGPLLVTVSSPGSGDGKSFIATNLALAFADTGHRTLLIDGDVRRGDLHRLIGGRRKPGLIDYLNGDVDQAMIVQSTRYPNLHFVGGGTRRQAAPELLSSGGMAELLVHMRSRYGVILIDSPPLGAGVDPFLLGTATGNMLLVLRTGVTDRELAEAKLDALDRLPIRILGAVLNDVRRGSGYRYYGYDYNVEGYEARDEEPEAAVRTGTALPRSD